MLPDEGKVEWSKYVTVGHSDQHAVLGRVKLCVMYPYRLDELFKAEARINDLYMEMAEDGADIDALMEEVGEPKIVWRVVLILDVKIDEVARARCHGLWHGYDVTALTGGQRTKVLLAKSTP